MELKDVPDEEFRREALRREGEERAAQFRRQVLQAEMDRARWREEDDAFIARAGVTREQFEAVRDYVLGKNEERG